MIQRACGNQPISKSQISEDYTFSASNAKNREKLCDHGSFIYHSFNFKVRFCNILSFHTYLIYGIVSTVFNILFYDLYCECIK